MLEHVEHAVCDHEPSHDVDAGHSDGDKTQYTGECGGQIIGPCADYRANNDDTGVSGQLK